MVKENYITACLKIIAARCIAEGFFASSMETEDEECYVCGGFQKVKLTTVSTAFGEYLCAGCRKELYALLKNEGGKENEETTRKSKA